MHRSIEHSASTGRGAFTLIELLVVISIVSLLSSVVLASLNTARENARIAASAQFEATVYHELASEATVIIPFEEGSGSTINDIANGGTGILNGTASWTTSTYGTASKYALSFNGSSNRIAFSSCGLMNRLVGASGITTSRWVYLNSYPSSGNTYIVDFIGQGGGGAGHVVGVNSNGTIGVQARSNPSDALQGINGSTVLATGKWYNVIASVDYVAKTVSIYVNGQLDIKASATFGSSVFAPSACSATDMIGSSPTPDRYLDGRVDNYRVYAQTI